MVVAKGFLSVTTMGALMFLLCLEGSWGVSQELGFETVGSNTSVNLAAKPGMVSVPQQAIRARVGSELQGTLLFFSRDGLQSVSKGVAVRLIRKGQVVAATETGPDGQFRFSRIESGVNTIVAAKGELLAVHAVTILADDSAGAGTIEVVAASGVPANRSRAMLAAVNKPGMTQVADVAIDDSVEAMEPSNDHRIMLDAAGGFRGSVSVPGQTITSGLLKATMVRVIRNGVTVAEGQVEATGSYEVAKVGPGPASLVIFGPAGFAARGVEFVSPTLQTEIPTTTERFVNIQPRESGGSNTDLAPVDDVEEGLEDIEEETDTNGEMVGTPLEIPPPATGTGFGGGGGGGPGSGGGGGGGTGGLGGLVGLAAIGATLAAALSSGDDDGFTPAPASPATP